MCVNTDRLMEKRIQSVYKEALSQDAAVRLSDLALSTMFLVSPSQCAERAPGACTLAEPSHHPLRTVTPSRCDAEPM